jgi:hypothetical protein
MTHPQAGYSEGEDLMLLAEEAVEIRVVTLTSAVRGNLRKENHGDSAVPFGTP